MYALNFNLGGKNLHLLTHNLFSKHLKLNAISFVNHVFSNINFRKSRFVSKSNQMIASLSILFSHNWFKNRSTMASVENSFPSKQVTYGENNTTIISKKDAGSGWCDNSNFFVDYALWCRAGIFITLWRSWFSPWLCSQRITLFSGLVFTGQTPILFALTNLGARQWFLNLTDV